MAKLISQDTGNLAASLTTVKGAMTEANPTFGLFKNMRNKIPAPQRICSSPCAPASSLLPPAVLSLPVVGSAACAGQHPASSLSFLTGGILWP